MISGNRVNVYIRGTHNTCGDAADVAYGGTEVIESHAVGVYSVVGDREYIRYGDKNKDKNGATITGMIKLYDGCVEVVRKGNVGGRMIFDACARTESYWDTPYGGTGIEIDTHKLEIKRSKQALEIMIEYEISAHGESFNRIQMCIEVSTRIGGLLKYEETV